VTADSAVETLSYPEADTVSDLVARAIDRGAMVTLFGRCTVEYDGAVGGHSCRLAVVA